MTVETVDLLKVKIEAHVRDLFAANPRPDLVYHNLDHTESVVRHALDIAESCDLSEEGLLILYAAAWFHDTGQLFAEQKRHEEESVQIVNRFFDTCPEVSSAVVAHTERCILATKMPQVPSTLWEEILCDADTYNLGTPYFFETNERVKEEMRLKGLDVQDWDTGALQLLERHVFHTDCCKEKLDAGKARNIVLLRQKLAAQR